MRATELNTSHLFVGEIEAIARKDHDLTGEYKLIVERAATDVSRDAELARRFAGHLKSHHRHQRPHRDTAARYPAACDAQGETG